MEKHEVPFGGVYRLLVEGKLVGEFVPGPIWSQLYQATEAAHENVSYSWVPFAEKDPAVEFQKYDETIASARGEVIAIAIEALEEAEKHLPVAEGSTEDFIQCSCGNTVRPHYWTRHTQGSNGSALAPRTIEIIRDILDEPNIENRS